MASTAHKTSEELEEPFDEPEVLAAKAKRLAALLRGSKHAVFFTGAGISTSCGIPDFRGPDGIWTLRAQGRTSTKPSRSSLSCVPSYTHMAIKTLIDEGVAAGLISQNTDGLHRKSGVDLTRFAELHGNTNLEICSRCGREYMRDFRTRSAQGSHSHETPRRCVVGGCRGVLHDTVVNFGESLPEKHITRGFQFAEESDVCIVLGSSCRVTPAADMPARIVERGGSLVICNLQRTPLDKDSELRVWARVDDLMRLVMAELGIEVPTWKLERQLTVAAAHVRGGTQLTISSTSRDGLPATVVRSAAMRVDGSKKAISADAADGADFRPSLVLWSPVPVADGAVIPIRIDFFGHYEEPPIVLQHAVVGGTTDRYDLAYDLSTRKWGGTSMSDGSGAAAGAGAIDRAGPSID